MFITTPTTTPAPRTRHPALEGWPKGVFNPAAVGVVPGYPRTPETYARHTDRLRANHAKAKAAGKLNRRGAPNGWAGRKAEVAELRQKAADEAWQVVNILQRNSARPDERLDASPTEAERDAERFNIAAAFAIGFILDPTRPTKLRVEAARMILPFLTPMPARGGLRGLDDGLACLRGLIEEAGGDAWRKPAGRTTAFALIPLTLS